MDHAKTDVIMAPCGLLCNECDIYRAQSEPEIAQKTIRWFKEARNVDLKLEQLVCDGCLGDPSKLWSSGCGIRGCLMSKEMTSCHRCGDFPCERLEKWGALGPRYGAALSRLKELRQKGE